MPLVAGQSQNGFIGIFLWVALLIKFNWIILRIQLVNETNIRIFECTYSAGFHQRETNLMGGFYEHRI